MRFTTRSLRGCLSGCLAAALCAFALAGVAPTSAADIAGTQATGSYEITIHEDETVDNVMTLTVDNMPEEQFSAFCTQTSFLSSGGYPTDVEQIEKDGKPACKVSNTGVPLDEVSQLSMTITHSGGQFDFSTMVSGEVRVATVTVTFPGRVTNANESGVTDGTPSHGPNSKTVRGSRRQGRTPRARPGRGSSRESPPSWWWSPSPSPPSSFSPAGDGGRAPEVLTASTGSRGRR